MAPMTAWRLAALLALYVSLDLACPVVPGAFAFAPDESAEAVRQTRWVPPPPAALTVVARVEPSPAMAQPLRPRPERACRPLILAPRSSVTLPVEASPAVDD